MWYRWSTQSALAAERVPSLVEVSVQGQQPMLTPPGSSGGCWGGNLLETVELSTLGGGAVGGGRTGDGGAPLTIPAAAGISGVVRAAAQQLSRATPSPPARDIAGVRHNEEQPLLGKGRAWF